MTKSPSKFWYFVVHFFRQTNEHSQEFHYYSFAVQLDRCVGSCNGLNDLSDELGIPIKTEDLNLSEFNMITGLYESKTLKKHISCG